MQQSGTLASRFRSLCFQNFFFFPLLIRSDDTSDRSPFPALSGSESGPIRPSPLKCYPKTQVQAHASGLPFRYPRPASFVHSTDISQVWGREP
jgi:hypothetical protein